ncbi:MAG TPA: molybdate ABC transporter permease subunit [Polyangiaceae bacterium]|jgi:molybdate transport system permease protein|nr:molybdate ABC transporter permease subunit [Polyangiaceae bacterium]
MSSAEAFPIWLSLRVAALAMVIVTPLGVWIAWTQATKRYRLRTLVDALVLLPFVLPPSVIGFFLVVIFGRRGLVGRWLEEVLGLRIIFTPAAAVLAACIVAFPILVKTVQPSIEAVPAELHAVGSSLGLGPLALFFRVTLRAAWPGVVTGLVLAFVRAVGEFGATLMFAGNIPGETNTMALEIFAAYQAGDDARALVYVLVLSIMSSLTVVVAARLSPQQVPS